MTQPDHDKGQADKFRDMARELECDEDEAAFEDKVRKVAKDGRESEPKTSGGQSPTGSPRRS